MCHTSRFSCSITYTCEHWQTYWHTSMADRYDINDISQLSFVSTLCELSFLPCELPSRSISWLNFYLCFCASFTWRMGLLTLKPLCMSVSTVFLLTSRPCLIPNIFRLVYSCISVFPSSALVREVKGREVDVSECQLDGSEFWSPRIWILSLAPLFCDYRSLWACVSFQSSCFL